MRTYRDHKAFYDKLQQDVAAAAGNKVVDPDTALAQVAASGRLSGIVAKFNPAVILISGCQDNQTSMDGEHNGAFTEQLLKVWNQGALPGQLRQLPRAHQGAPAGDADRRTCSRSARRASSWRRSRSASDAVARAFVRVSRGASMASGTSEITFIVPGQAQPAAPSPTGAASSHLGSRRHAARQRRAGARQRAPGRRRRRPQRRQRADAGAPSRRCARPDAGAERCGDAQRAGDDGARSGARARSSSPDSSAGPAWRPRRRAAARAAGWARRC